MCGICGVVSPDAENNRLLIQKMCAVISHRGPDDEGIFAQSSVALGMRRLSIIDVQGGDQPIFNEDRSACIIFNGEIYNYLELRDVLSARGHVFQTHSDTEAILHAYEEWGEECPKKLRGMFAFAIWDQRRQRLFLSRDRLGKKPLYYFIGPDFFIFGSEIKSLLEHPGVSRHLDLDAFQQYLTFGYVPAPLTLFHHILKLPAASFAVLANNRLTIQEYWDVSGLQQANVSFTEAKERVKELLEEAVRIRLMSEVPLGAYLSGGLDSSVVVALMSRSINRPVDTFSVGFEDKDNNELPYARIMAQHLRTNHHEILLSSLTPDLVECIVYHMDEPVCDPAAIPTILLSELARKTVTVILTGEGGDEIFGGYEQYRIGLSAKRRQIFTEALNRRVLPFFAHSVNRLRNRAVFHDRTIWFWSLPENQQMIAWVANFTDAEKKKFLAQTQKAAPGFDPLAPIARYYDRHAEASELGRLKYIDTKIWLPDDLLMKVDKMSMAHSIEARTPYLDHQLVEYASTLPDHFLLHGNSKKYILKETAKNWIPAEIVNREKHTFDVPIGKWIQRDLHDFAFDVFSPSNTGFASLFNVDYIRGEGWSHLANGNPGFDHKYWGLLIFGLWLQKFGVSIQ
jgi:asparagine synthase (glutamine-hydrolysing)